MRNPIAMSVALGSLLGAFAGIGIGLAVAQAYRVPHYRLTFVDEAGEAWTVDSGLTLEDCIRDRVEWRACELDD